MLTQASNETRENGEFDLIRRFFSARIQQRPEVILGIGDDAAVVRTAAGCDNVIAVDTLIENVHFPANAPASSVGHKCLAVNLSDMAAMGAEPVWATLAISLPSADTAWLGDYLDGFNALAEKHGVALIGGDTTRGALSISVQIGGQVPHGQAIRRSGARPGDRVGVTGYLGDAAAGLRLHQADQGDDYLVNRLHRPTPRVAEGLVLRDFASAMIDVSDGLAADLGHILEQSGVGARIDVDALPLSEPMLARFTADRARAFALGGGDDYELCFTVAPERVAPLEEALSKSDAGVRWIGEIREERGLDLRTRTGDVFSIAASGFDHFGSE